MTRVLRVRTRPAYTSTMVIVLRPASNFRSWRLLIGRNLAEFVESYRDKRVAETWGRDNLSSLALTYAAIESAALGEEVCIGGTAV